MDDRSCATEPMSENGRARIYRHESTLRTSRTRMERSGSELHGRNQRHSGHRAGTSARAFAQQ